MLTVKNIQQYYGGSHILRDVGFEARAGEVTVLLGRNGVGKTTLLKSLMGLVPIKSGHIEFDGQRIERRTPYERARAGIGFVPQGREIFSRLTVQDNLAMGLAYRPAGTPIPRELFELFPILEQMRGRRGGDLSGGQQQQLAIARALAPGPRLLWCWTSRPRAFSPASSRTSAASSACWPRAATWPSCCASSTTTLPKSWPTSIW